MKTRKYLDCLLQILGNMWACLGRPSEIFLPNPIFKLIIHKYPLFIREDSKEDGKVSSNKIRQLHICHTHTPHAVSCYKNSVKFIVINLIDNSQLYLYLSKMWLQILGNMWACLGRSSEIFLPNPIFKFIIHKYSLFIR